jgi:hypothetical protein
MADNQYSRDFTNRLTFEMFNVPADSYRAICREIVARFQLVADNALVTDGLALVFQDYRRAEQVVGLGWDNWLGFTVVAKTPASEPLVQEIGTWLLQSPWAMVTDEVPPSGS